MEYTSHHYGIGITSEEKFVELLLYVKYLSADLYEN